MADGEKPPKEQLAVPKRRAHRAARKKAAARKSRSIRERELRAGKVRADYPRHSLERALRIPKAILDQNAGRECSEGEAAGFAGSALGGTFRLELSSASKFGLLERPSTGRVQPTELAKKILRPQSPKDELEGLREALLKAPDISDVYKHYRGENLPDDKFFDNALTDTFGVPADKLAEFKPILLESLKKASLVQEHQGRLRVIDASKGGAPASDEAERIRELGKGVRVSSGDTCFVMMPFAAPLGTYYSLVYEPAITRAGLTPVRADADIFATGKIMDQVWDGIRAAKILVAELTTRNPNVFYELGLAHALGKPVVLVSSNTEDVPFDLQHIRVIYYDVSDPFWGQKLQDKVAENILSALRNPSEAMFKAPK